jgi:transcriptional regulator with XRE-family HTH domain
MGQPYSVVAFDNSLRFRCHEIPPGDTWSYWNLIVEVGMSEGRRDKKARSLFSLRSALERTQKDVAAAVGLKDGSQLSQFENGRPLSYDYLQAIAAAVDVPPEGVEALLFAHGLLSLGRPEESAAEGASALALTPKERFRIWRTVLAGGWILAEELFAELAYRKRMEKVERVKREAAEQWTHLKALPAEDRYDLVKLYPALRSPALVAQICEASARAAAHKVSEARELADFAFFVAGQVPGGSARRARAEGYASEFVANALRVATDFDAADATFAQAWTLWQDGDPSEPELLPEWRLHDLEASLRRAQRRFPEALACLERAFALCKGEPAAAGHVLLNKEHLFDAMGDTEGALAALQEAAPLVEAAGDLQKLFALRFNTVDNLCTLQRYAEAAAGLPVVREMAISLAHEIYLIRVAWLSAKVDTGQGRKEEAIAGLEQVNLDFMAHQLPYEAALSSLDLAVLLLEAGRTAEVRNLAFTLKRIFKAKKIDREALMALGLFCKAALRETATIELAKRAIAAVEKARRSAPPS